MPLELSDSARSLLRLRYLRRDEEGRIIETEEELFWRVARAVAAAEDAFPRGPRSAEIAEKFYELMTTLRFLPNTPALINAGTQLGQLFACFVIPVPDSLDGIFGAVRDAAKIQQTGGGTGFSFSHLRPRGDLVRSTRRPSSGAVSFIRIFDVASDVIATESVRGGANMAVLRCDHPDVREFIDAKRNPALFSRFNFFRSGNR
jgi:ribonucleoside-diphosphate reductase alpha chain